MLHKYITSNPAALKIKTKINGEDQTTSDSYKNYSISDGSGTNYSRNRSAHRGSGMRRMVLMKVEPVISETKGLGHVHQSNNSETVNNTLLVEI